MQRSSQRNIMFKSSKKKLIISGCSYTANYAKIQKLEEFPIWGELLADQLNMELINLSKCGFGNQAIYTTLVDKMIADKNVGLVVAMWTEFQRMSWYIDIDALDYVGRKRNAASVHKPWQCFLPERIVKDADWHDRFYKPPAENPKKKSMKYQLGKMVNDRELDSIRAGTVQSLGYMFAFQNICENVGIPYLQLQGCWPVLAKDPPKFSKTIKQLTNCIIDSPYIDSINDNFIGWPIVESIGGYCFDSLLTKHNYRISLEDTHPNGEGHKLINKVLHDAYKKIYS